LKRTAAASTRLLAVVLAIYLLKRSLLELLQLCKGGCVALLRWQLQHVPVKGYCCFGGLVGLAY
jgi:hypothetical protein